MPSSPRELRLWARAGGGGRETEEEGAREDILFVERRRFRLAGECTREVALFMIQFYPEIEFRAPKSSGLSVNFSLRLNTEYPPKFNFRIKLNGFFGLFKVYFPPL
jgi:hypothetical protein